MTPHWLKIWLNKYHDLRTLPMAWGYAIVPALLLVSDRPLRRLCLLIVLAVLLLGEVAQLVIPNRSFTWLDVLFSILGVSLAEWMAILIIRRKH